MHACSSRSSVRSIWFCLRTSGPVGWIPFSVYSVNIFHRDEPGSVFTIHNSQQQQKNVYMYIETVKIVVFVPCWSWSDLSNRTKQIRWIQSWPICINESLSVIKHNTQPLPSWIYYMHIWIWTTLRFMQSVCGKHDRAVVSLKIMNLFHIHIKTHLYFRFKPKVEIISIQFSVFL